MVVPQGAFTIVERHAIPQQIGGRALLDCGEWLRLTLGRFLAPAELPPTPAPADVGRVDQSPRPVRYLLLGKVDPSGPERTRTLDGQLRALEQLLAGLHEDLRPLIEGSERLDGSLIALGMLLELNLPQPHPSDVHLRAGQLQLSGWGLQDLSGSQPGPRLRQLCGAPGRVLRDAYLADLRSALGATGGRGDIDAAASAAERDPRPGPGPGWSRRGARRLSLLGAMLLPSLAWVSPWEALP